MSLSDANNKKYEQLMEDIGGFGKFQKRLCLLLVLGAVPNGYFALSMVFIGRTPSYRCFVPVANGYPLESTTEVFLARNFTTNNTTLLSNNTQNTTVTSQTMDSCVFPTRFLLNDTANDSSLSDQPFCPYGIVYGFEEGRTSIVTEWDLICSRAWIIPLITTIYMSGALVGSLLSGILSDNIGRKPTFILGTILMFVALALCGLSISPAMFTAFLFVAGGAGFVKYISAFIIALEMINSKDRVVTGTLVVVGFAGGYMLLPLFAYYIGNWRTLCLVLGALGVVFIPYIWIIPESPRWLYSKGKITEFKKLFLKIANVNGVNDEKAKTLLGEFLSENDVVKETLLTTDENESHIVVQKTQHKQFSYVDLLRIGVVRSRTLCMWFTWFVCSIVYYCLALNTSNMGGNPYINCFVAAAVEIPAYVMVMVLLKWHGRKPVLISTLLVAGVTCAAVPYLKQINNELSITFAMIGKLSVSSSFSIIFIVSSELFPTLMRSMGVGSSSMAARVAGMIAPYILYLGKTYASAPYLIMGVMAAMASALNTLLPETMNTALPETVSDLTPIQFPPCLKTTKIGKKANSMPC